MSTETVERPQPRKFAVIGSGSLWDGIAYWATLAGVYLMVGGLMFYSGKDKLFDSDGHAPPRALRALVQHPGAPIPHRPPGDAEHANPRAGDAQQHVVRERADPLPLLVERHRGDDMLRRAID